MPNIKSIFHINVNVTNFERSLKFYEMLGFHVVRDFGEFGDRSLARGLGAKECHGRGVLMILGDDLHSTRLDLIEWKVPPTEGRPYPHLFHAGACRIALRTKTLRADYEELKGHGVKFLSEPQMFHAQGTEAGFVCMTDPDGTVIELLQVRAAHLRKASKCAAREGALSSLSACRHRAAILTMYCGCR